MNISISLDPSALRLSQLDAAQWRQSLTPNRCTIISKHRDEYLQIEHDNSNLIWLYTLMLEEGIVLPETEVIAAMKQRLLEEKTLTPMAWRYVANGTAQDFRIALDSEDPGDTPNWRWKGLVYWLQILSGLRRELPIAEPIQCLFLHDSLLVIPESNEVQFRGAWMSFNTLRHIIEETERRLEAGTLKLFSETELVEVVTWLAATDPDLDSNQTKKGWKYLSRKAAEWKVDAERMSAYQELRWDSAFPKTQIDKWTIEPIIDAWSLHRLAISQRHCGDRYIEGCIAGSDRIFVIHNAEGKTVATLRLTLNEESWAVGDVRGFANTVVPPKLSSFGEDVARIYTEIEKGIMVSSTEAISIGRYATK